LLWPEDEVLSIGCTIDRIVNLKHAYLFIRPQQNVILYQVIENSWKAWE